MGGRGAVGRGGGETAASSQLFALNLISGIQRGHGRRRISPHQAGTAQAIIFNSKPPLCAS